MSTTITDAYLAEHVVPGPFRSIEDIKRANAAIGQTWFSADTLRWWKGRVGADVFGGRLFVSSESGWGTGNVRRYTVRCASDDGRISMIGDMSEYATLAAAKRAAAAIVRSAHAAYLA